MAKTVIPAPGRQRPANGTPTQQRPPLGAEQSAAPEETPTPAEALSEAEAIEQRLADGLAGVAEKRGDHEAALAQIAEGLAALPGWVEAAETHLAALQQEQAQLPRKINAAKALLLAASGTRTEGEAKEELEALQGRQETLPPERAKAEAELQQTRAACEAKQAQLEQDRADHETALVELREFALALQEAADKARRHLGEAKLASIQAERQVKQGALEQAKQHAAEASAALAALDTEAQAALASWPDLKLGYQQAYIPVADGVTRRLEAGIAYRKELLDWYHEGSSDWALGMNYEWFRPGVFEWSSLPFYMKQIIGEMERRLAQHTAEQQRRIR
ncbi:MAG TPA: hypothetical protein VFU69_17415 [Ktedonobacterales bacterium]|nr:hypothetical protein [Ktedonobacterales bacterium]